MKPATFKKLVKARQIHTNETLLSKATEYARNNDRLHNFKKAASMNDQTSPQALWGMMSKHLVSIMDMIDDTEQGIYPTDDQIDEKLGDAHNYLYLLEGLFVEGASLVEPK